MKKRKGPKLPAMLILARSKADVVRLSEAVEAIISHREKLFNVIASAEGIVAELAGLAAELKRAVAERRKPAKARSQPEAAPTPPWTVPPDRT